MEPLTIVNFCNATKEKTLAKEYAKYATYLLKVIKGCQLRDTHSKLFAMKTLISSLFNIHISTDQQTVLAYQQGQSV